MNVFTLFWYPGPWIRIDLNQDADPEFWLNPDQIRIQATQIVLRSKKKSKQTFYITVSSLPRLISKE
jgi:hypothetical protein